MSKISPLGTSVYHIFNQPKTIIMLSNPSENPDHGKRIPSSSLHPTGGNAKLISIQPFPLLSTSISTVHPPTKVGCCGKRNPLNFSLYDEPLEKKPCPCPYISFCPPKPQATDVRCCVFPRIRTSGQPEWTEKIKNRHPRTNIPNRTGTAC